MERRQHWNGKRKDQQEAAVHRAAALPTSPDFFPIMAIALPMGEHVEQFGADESGHQQNQGGYIHMESVHAGGVRQKITGGNSGQQPKKEHRRITPDLYSSQSK